MKAALVLLFAAAAFAAPVTFSTFKAWASENNRMYSVQEEAKRFAIFQENARIVDELNAENNGAEFRLNEFADLTNVEFRKLHLNSKRPNFGALPVAKPAVVGEMDKEFTWVTRGAVNPVKNQGSCGSCWAFSANVNMEAVTFLKTKKLYDLSESQLVDCDHECQDPKDKETCDNGCQGGLMDNAFNYAIKNGMQATESYPYKAANSACKYNKDKVVARFTNMTYIEKNETAIQQWVFKNGPVSIAVHASPWQFYFGGVYSNANCKQKLEELDHGVAIVGWGLDASKGPYWIIKNSWGAKWGKEGYIWILMGKNICGVNQFAVSTIA